MKKTLLCILFAAFGAAADAQTADASTLVKVNKPTATLYGFVRNDMTYDSRMNATAFDGLFLLYPLDVRPDAVGEDLNAIPNSVFFSFISRIGINVGDLRFAGMDLTGKIESDFAGMGTSNGLLRIRQAYIKATWGKHSALTFGQAWHPMFGPVTPSVISLSVGAPFNPFSRSPQIRYDYQACRFQLTGALIRQFQYTSLGPVGKSTVYQKQANVPELFAGANYSDSHFTLGAAVNYLTIKPRTQSTVGTQTYKVDESLGSLSWEAYARYTTGLLTLSAKTVRGQNMNEQTMLGGFGVSDIDPTTGRQTYVNFTQQTTWANVTYGKKLQGGLFAGYSRNTGADKALVPGSEIYLEGLRVGALRRLCATLSYNVPHLLLGVEWEITSADYGNGEMNPGTGRYDSSHVVTNHRAVGVVSYLF